MYKKLYAAVFITVFLLLITGSISMAKVYTVSGSFSSNGDSISGWYWLRAKGHIATWTFEASQLEGAKSVYINVHGLVTNKAGGGPGYGTSVKFLVTGGGTSQTVKVELHNPFKPQDQDGSDGTGYDCYGSGGTINNKIWKKGGQITITAAYPFSNNYHVALNQSSLYLGFKK